MAAYSGGWLGFGGFGRRGEEDLGGGLKEDVVGLGGCGSGEAAGAVGGAFVGGEWWAGGSGGGCFQKGGSCIEVFRAAIPSAVSWAAGEALAFFCGGCCGGGCGGGVGSDITASSSALRTASNISSIGLSSSSSIGPGCS